MHDLNRCFFDPFQCNLQIPIKTCHIRQDCARPCRNLRFPTPFLHPDYTCPTFAYFIISPVGRLPGETCWKSRASPEREYRGHGMGRVRACAAENKISYIFHTHRSSQRGCGLFMFDTFPTVSASLYTKAHNPTKERTPQKGPALFCCQGKEPQPAAGPSFSEIRK